MSGPKFVGGLINPNPVLEGYQLTKAATVAFTAMTGSPIQVDLTLPGNSAAITGDVAPTYSAATSTPYRLTWLRFSADATARTVTLPYDHWSINRSGNITTLLVPANGNLQVAIWYTGARWEIFNDSVAVDGTGSYVLQNIGGTQLATDHAYAGPLRTGILGETIALGALCSLHTDGKWYKADANTAAASSGDARRLLALCVIGGDADAVGTFLRPGGILRDDSFSFSNIEGAALFVSETAGELTATVPETASAVIRVAGNVRYDNEVEFNPETGFSTNAAS